MAAVPHPDETRKLSLNASDFLGGAVSRTAVDIGLPDSDSLTYEPYFGLRDKPFSLSPDPRFFFGDSSRRATFDALLAGIRRREGILALMGETGAGKTTLCRTVLQSLDRKTFAAFVPDPFLSREDLLKILLLDFGVFSVDEIRGGRLQGASRTDLAYPLHEFLTSLQPQQAFAVVMIDEAQNLAAQLLEEIRILADLETRHKLLQILFIGQPQLESHLASPEMRQLSQRVSVRCELTPLGRQDVGPYISHRLAVAGSDGRLHFAESATDLVYRASSGIPRVINLVCDRALLRTARCRRMIVTDGDILGAINDLKLPIAQNLYPLPWGDPGPELPKRSDPSPSLQPAPLQSAPLEPKPNEPSTNSIAPQLLFHTEQLFDERAAKSSAISPDAMQQRSSGGPSRSEAEGFEAEEIDEGRATQEYWSRVLVIVIAVLAVATAIGGYYRMMPVVSSQRQAVATIIPLASKPAKFVIETPPFRSGALAAKALQEFQKNGFDAYSAEVDLSDGGRGLSVFLGPYAERAPAERDLARTQQIPGYQDARIVPLP